MMNKLWAFIVIISIVISFVTGNYSGLASSVLEASKNAIDLSLIIGGSMCLWSGIMNIAEKSGLASIISKLFMPLLSKLLPDYKKNNDILNAVSMNITANILGLGNAATPLGLKAMELMNNYDSDKSKPSHSMIKFIIFNTASIQIIPTTIVALRLNTGSKDPFSIISFIWICSFVGLLSGLLLCNIFKKYSKEKK